MKNIAVAVDFSDNTDKLINQAIDLAKGFSSNVFLIHVESPNEDVSGRDSTEGVDEIQQLYHGETALLNNLAQTIRDHNIETHAIFVEGVIVDSILEEARRVNANVIIAGTHRHNAIEGLFLGGVSQGIVKQSSCPVFLVPYK
jgi:nucleotide-binding universal stress UspA family protein